MNLTVTVRVVNRTSIIRTSFLTAMIYALVYNQYIMNNCTWCGRPQSLQLSGLLVHGGGTAVALRPYQLVRRCLTVGTVHSDVTAISEWCTGRVPARTSNAHHCDVCGKTLPRPDCMRCERNVPADWASSNYSYYHRHLAAPHRTQFALYPSIPAGFGYMSPSAAACGAPPIAIHTYILICIAPKS